MDKLKSYRLDKAFTEGVDIILDHAPDVLFKVRLPSQYNRGYMQALYSGIELDSLSGVKTGATLMGTKYAQQEAFVGHCMVSVDGEPVPSNFRDEYPAALDELIEKATVLAGQLDAKVEGDAKKSPPSSSGKASGQGEKSSTGALNKLAG